jgi:hypothetical protein
MVCDPALFICVDDCRIHGSYGGCPDKSKPKCGKDGLCTAQ